MPEIRITRRFIKAFTRLPAAIRGTPGMDETLVLRIIGKHDEALKKP